MKTLSRNYAIGRIPGLGNKYIILGNGIIMGNTRGMGLKNIKTRISSNGYEQFFTRIDGRKKGFLVHRLVALTFIPNPHNKPQINHIDGNKRNNNVDNLEWVDSSENMKHAYRMGLLSKSGEKNSNASLKNSDVPFIKEMLRSGERAVDVAKRFGVSADAIYKIKYGKTWKEIE